MLSYLPTKGNSFFYALAGKTASPSFLQSVPGALPPRPGCLALRALKPMVSAMR
jgi:hypothetical protein